MSAPGRSGRYDTVPRSGSRGVAVGRALLALGGVAMIAWGAYVAVTRVPSSQWPSALVWLAGGIVLHDAVLAPVAIVVGALVLPRVPAPWRPALRGGMLALGVLAIFAVALLAGSAHRRNASVVPQDPLAALAVALGVLVVGVLLGAWWAVAARRRSALRD
ncbi:hypothetical protein [Cellulomonas sp. PhB143]|uniref:hypothetical protein n=1 Tax=Cellulomonas sp. PhB143 TaxID=2485186 RepID=UPI000F4731DE|nr:hypothetical protein [Cellulomonas sp. PhB143]ROS72068.1 hypothetical protein EDF32_2812 [Cellulomonas sp. PhB143]